MFYHIRVHIFIFIYQLIGLREKKYRKIPYFMENPLVPVDFPLSQPIESTNVSATVERPVVATCGGRTAKRNLCCKYKGLGGSNIRMDFPF